MDLYSLKQKSIESKEYIDQQKNSRIPIEYYNMTESLIYIPEYM